MSTADMDVEQRPDSKNGSNGSNSENHKEQSAEQPPDKPPHLPPELPPEQPPNCLAQADVKTPWLDINARFQLRSNARDEKPKKEKAEKSTKPLPFFGLPRFRSKGAAKPHSKNGKGTNGNGNYTGNGNGNGVPDAHGPEGSSEGGAEGDTSSDTSADGWHDLTVPKKRKIWHGWEGLAITIFGIAMPSVVLLMSAMSMPKRLTLVMLNHPLETIAELLLLISIPLANYIAWSAICNNNLRYTLRRGISMGAAIMSCLMVAGICVAGLFADNSTLVDDIGSSFAGGFIGLAIIATISGLACAYIVNRIRLTRDFKNSRLQVLAFTTVGAILSLITVIGAEYRPWMVRLAEVKASSKAPLERKLGLAQLRALDPERELLMECSDQKAAGLAGLFNPLKSSTQHELYFALTGRPYSFKDISNTDLSSMPDDYLSRHVVGERIDGLGMSRSYLSGVVHANTLSSTLEWTYVFKNDSKVVRQEARAEIGLPPGAVITGLKLWKQGEPIEAKFAASGKAEGASGFSIVGHDSPAIVTDLGHGRALLHCYPVEQSEEVKLQLTMVVPLKAEGDKAASLSLPKFIATNFNLNGDHLLKLRSNNVLTSTVKNLKAGASFGGQKALSGTLTPEQLENSSLLLTAERPTKAAPVAVLDKIAIKLEQQDIKAKELKAKKNAAKNKPQEQVVVMIDGSKGMQSQFDNLRKVIAMKNATPGGRKLFGKNKIKTIQPKYVVEKIVQTAAPAPKELVIVVDGSATMSDHIKNLVQALGRLPKGIPTHVIVASQEHPELLRPTPLKDALIKLQQMKFEGGQDNLQAVVKAAELAGETKGGAVLWAHGPLPALNEEIYIMPSYVATPAFFELPLGSGETDTYDFFKNHTEIGPFLQVPRNTTEVVDDLGGFFSKWRLDQNGYAVSLTRTSAKPDKSVNASPEEQSELLALHANQQIKEYLNTRHITKAARLAVEYGLVTPVSCALVQENSVDNVDAVEGADDAANNSDPEALASENKNESEAKSDSSDESTPAQEASSESDGNAPALQGATAGTIGPQGSDATFITGVNTAGTVRVNNLANLEAMLNIIANLLEVGCGLVGAVIVIHSLANKNFALDMMGQELEISQGQRIAIGVGILLFGLSFPGLLNWFVASARDANLFS
ncbi:MAG: hypothetical protein JST89_19890 [Cyanobacteria bacterium SZAS-4]|nr:hypothetical protein [Cyanobacteria bacterium SZAS-4]